jgi:hypothetical protein
MRQESDWVPGAVYFTAGFDEEDEEAWEVVSGFTLLERVFVFSGTLTISNRDGEIKLRIAPPYRYAFV